MRTAKNGQKCATLLKLHFSNFCLQELTRFLFQTNFSKTSLTFKVYVVPASCCPCGKKLFYVVVYPKVTMGPMCFTCPLWAFFTSF